MIEANQAVVNGEAAKILGQISKICRESHFNRA
jgi:hypothetical protein